MKRIHIFKTGKHTAAGGQVLEFSETDLQAAVAAYDPKVHEAPIVVGHPRDNAPAFGWVQSLEYAEGNTYANPHQVNADFADLVQGGTYKKVSASFYTPDSPNNPVPGVYYLRHVGFLGAQPPAIKGLQAVQFDEAEEGVVEFMEGAWAMSRLLRGLREWMIDKFSREEADQVIPDYLVQDVEDAARNPKPAPQVEPAFNEQNEDPTMTPEQIAAKEKELQDREQRLQTQEASFTERERAVAATEAAARIQGINTQVDKLVADGKILPAEKAGLVAFMQALDAGTVVEFSEDGKDVKQPVSDYLASFLGKLPKRVDFQERTPPADSNHDAPSDANALAAKALEFQETERKAGREISITQAVNHIMKQGGAE